MGGGMGMGMGMGEGPVDEAEAVGDPHLTSIAGDRFDLCCNGGECSHCPEDFAFIQSEENTTVEDESEENTIVEDESEENTTDGDEIDPANLCRSGIKVLNICYANSCGRTGQRPGGRNCGSLPGGANACCMTRITKSCTGPNMDRCRIPRATGMGMGGAMGMGGGMGMGMGMGMGEGPVDEAEAVGDPHMSSFSGEKFDLCCSGGNCSRCAEDFSLIQSVKFDENAIVNAEINPANLCQSGIKVLNVCYANSCGRTGQRPGGRNCGSLPGGGNACCMTRITRSCTGPNMDRCRIPRATGMGMGGGMGMGMGMGGGGDDEAEAVGDPHMTSTDGVKFDLCCSGGNCGRCPQ